MVNCHTGTLATTVPQSRPPQLAWWSGKNVWSGSFIRPQASFCRQPDIYIAKSFTNILQTRRPTELLPTPSCPVLSVDQHKQDSFLSSFCWRTFKQFGLEKQKLQPEALCWSYATCQSEITSWKPINCSITSSNWEECSCRETAKEWISNEDKKIAYGEWEGSERASARRETSTEIKQQLYGDLGEMLVWRDVSCALRKTKWFNRTLPPQRMHSIRIN